MKTLWMTLATSSLAFAAQKPNLVFILQDDHGWWDTASHGNTDPLVVNSSANVNALAREGIMLDNHYVHWHCSPTRRTFLTGRLPLHHTELLSDLNTDDIDLRWTWISEKLSSVGYKSYWFGKGHTGYKSWAHLPANRGFNGGSVLFFAGSGSYTKLPRWNGTQPLERRVHEYSTDLFGALAVNAVKKHDPSVPLFLYLPWQATHAPYDLPPSCQNTSCPNPIQAMLADSDRWTGELVAALKSKGMYDNTLIVYSSDNGGVASGNNYPLRGEKHTNWQGGMRVDAFVSGGLVPAKLRGTTNPHYFHVADWYPTFCKLAGVDGTDDPPVPPLDPAEAQGGDIYQGNLSYPPVDGKDIWPQITGVSDKVPHPMLWLSAEVLIKDEQYKLMVANPSPETMSAGFENNGWKSKDGVWDNPPDEDWSCSQYKDRTNFKPCLFDLKADPSERTNLADSKPDLVRKMWAELNRTALTAYASRSPDDLVGPCNKQCAQQKFGSGPSPICGVPGCGPETFVTV